MKNLKDVTLVIADTYNYGSAVASLKKSMAQCNFGRVIFFTNIPIKLAGIDIIQIPELKGKDAYSYFILKEAYKYITTNYVIVSQHDSWVLDGEQFDNRLYNVDYAGALWLENDGLANGNGGFSWRSRMLMETVANDELMIVTAPEDVQLCRTYRRYFEKKYGLVWASDEICEQFSFELRIPNRKTFGFHSYFHPPFKPTIVVKRMAAMGDVIQVEPLLQYFHDKGYRVVLDTMPQFLLLFISHYFPVYSLAGLDQRILDGARVINLDMSYESQPEKLHLQTYFEYAGVPEEEYKPYLKNPTLSLGFNLDGATKIFKKYVVFHTDNRAQGGRRIHGVDWQAVVRHVTEMGYTAIQVGRDDTAIIKNAIQVNCTNENFLSYVVGGADMMVGIDSGISHIASAFKVPSVICFGSVDPKVIHADLSDKIIIHNHDEGVCDKPFCWGSTVGTEGVKCYIDEQLPPCSIFKTSQILEAITKLHDKNHR